MKKLISMGMLLVVSQMSMALPQAVTEGQDAGNSAVSSSAGMVTQSSSNTVNQMNNATSADTATVQDLQAQFAVSNAGNSGLGTQGNSQLDRCQNYVPNQARLNATPPDPVEVAAQQECAAVNDLAGQPLQNAINQSGLTRNDSLFQNPNNMYNTGNTNAHIIAGGALGSVGSGVDSGVTGGGSCVTSTETTPATYTYGSCTRSNVPSTQNCQVAIAPTITTTPFCTLGGSTPVLAANNPNMYPAWSHAWQSWWSAPGPNGTITYGCRSATDPLYATGGRAYYNHNPNWVVTGGINFAVYPITLSYITGVNSPSIATAPIINYDGAGLGSIGMYYHGATDNFFVAYNWASFFYSSFYQNGPPSPPLVSCAPGYAYVPKQAFTSVYAPKDCTYSEWGTFCTAGTVRIPEYCTAPTDTSSVPVRKTYTTAAVIQNGYSVSAYVTCDPDNPWSGCTVNSPYRMTSGNLGWSGQCWNGPCTIQKVNPCSNGFVPFEDSGGSWLGWCYPPVLTVSLPTINTNRAVRQYAMATGHYTGEAGTTKTLQDNINDTCQTLQSQTNDPTAIPAVAVNGVYICPTGKTLSGIYCI